MKYHQPQNELPGAETAFNLITEQTQDGEKRAREIRQREQDAREAKQIEAEQQLTFI